MKHVTLIFLDYISNNNELQLVMYTQYRETKSFMKHKKCVEIQLHIEYNDLG